MSLNRLRGPTKGKLNDTNDVLVSKAEKGV